MLHPEILLDTLRNAARFRPYDKSWGPNATSPEKLVFEQLPLITKEEYSACYEENLSRGDPGQAVVRLMYSSGTTGDTYYGCRTAEDLDRIRDFYRELTSEAGAGVVPALRPIILDFVTRSSGNNERDALRIPALLTSPERIRQAIWLLTKTFKIPGHQPRISVMVGNPKALMYFTSEVIRQGVDVASIAVDELHSYSDYPPRPHREFLERFWGSIAGLL